MTAAPSPPSRPRAWAIGVLVLAVTLGLLSALVRYGPTTDAGHALIARLASGQRVGDLGWLRVEGVEGDPWSDFTVARAQIVDSRGVWLDARNLSAHWRPSELWRRRVRLTAVAARNVTVIRAPVMLPSQPPSPAPVSVRIDKANAQVTLGPGLAGRRGDYLLEGQADIGRDNTASGRLAASSLTHAGDFLHVGFNITHDAVGLEAHALEATGGALAGSLGLDPNQPFLLDARVHGSARAGWFTLSTEVGKTSPALASGQWSPAGGQASGRLDLTASRWLAPWRKGLGDRASVVLTAARAAGDLYHVALDARSGNIEVTTRGDVDVGRRRAGPEGVAVAVTVGDLSALAGVPGLGAARMTGRWTGDDSRWRLAGAAAVDKAQAAGFRLARVQGPFQLDSVPAGLVLKVQAAGVGGAGTSPVAVLLGAAPRAVAEVDWLNGGRILLRAVELHGAALDLQGHGERGLFGGLSFEGRALAHNIGAVAPGAQGTITADWRASQASGAAPWAFSVDARGQGLRLASAEANSLLGSTPRLHGDGRYGAGGLTIERASLEGGALSITGAGAAGANGGLTAQFAWTQKGTLALGPLAFSGPSKGTGAVSGTMGRPRLDLAADLKAIDLPDLGGLRLRDGRLAVTVMADRPDITGHVGLTATGNSGPARAGAAFRLAKAGVALSDIDFDAGGATAKGSANFTGAEPTLADLTVAVGPGVFLDQGHASGRVQITQGAGGPRAHLAVSGSNLVFPGGSAGLETVSLTADGPLARLPYRVEAQGSASGVAGRLSGSGVLSGGASDRSVTFAGAGRVGAADFHTVAPAQIDLRPAGVSGALHLGVGKGRADVTFNQSGASLNGRAVLAALDVGLLNAEMRGKADGVVTLSRVGNALIGSAQARVSGLASRFAEGASSLDGSLDATFGQGSVALNAELKDAHGSHLSTELQLPAELSADPFRLALDSRRPVSGRFSADGAVGPLWDLLEPGRQSLSGRLVAEGTIGGTLADPRLTGTASLAGGEFEDAGVGLVLKGLAVRADLKGDAVDVASVTASDGGRGAMSGSGRLSLVRDGVSSLRLGLRGFRLFDTPLGQAIASGNLDVNRAADGKVKLAGALTVDRAQISPTAAAPSGVVPMDVVEIHRPSDVGAPLPAPQAHAPPVALDISLRAPGGIFIKGRGLNLEMSLDAHVSGTSDAPVLTGVARVVRGDYDFAGKRFQLDDRSAVYLGATPETIRLDLTATREDPTLTAVISIKGTAAAPLLTLSSTPALPQDEVLSQVLFGASAAQLSPFQAAQLASAVAGMAGSGGFDVIGGLRNFAHLDRLAIDSSAATGFTVAGGKYVSDKVYIELSNSARGGQGVQVEWRIRKHLSIVSRVTDQGDNALSIRWRKDY
ncbi:MAG: autotransporter [Caulobacteraceae bacterium]|nr:autotransporter [Caulobacteraceae bacterium]